MWEYFEPEEQRWYRWKLDGATAWLRKNGEEWRLAVSPVSFKQIKPGASGPEPAKAPEHLPISFAVGPGRKVALRPRLGDMPYLVSARNDVRILPGAEAWFTIALPPLVRFEIEGGQILFESSPFTTGLTWFGDKTAGSLCLSLPLELDPECHNENEGRSGDDSLAGSSRYLSCRSLVQCRMVVRNLSKEAIDLKRMAIYTDLINLYLKDDMVVSDTVVVVGTADGSLQTSIDDKAYRGLPKVRSAPHPGLSEVLVRRGVSFLKAIAGL